MSTAADFGRWLQRQLDRHDLNQSEFGRRAGVSSSTVNAWVRGERLPDPSSCDLIADALGYPVEVVMKIAGHLPDVEPVDIDNPVARLMAQAQTVDWKTDESREMIISDILRRWASQDRKREAG